jgi:hypothetical protein
MVLLSGPRRCGRLVTDEQAARRWKVDTANEEVLDPEAGKADANPPDRPHRELLCI